MDLDGPLSPVAQPPQQKKQKRRHSRQQKGGAAKQPAAAKPSTAGKKSKDGQLEHKTTKPNPHPDLFSSEFWSVICGRKRVITGLLNKTLKTREGIAELEEMKEAGGEGIPKSLQYAVNVSLPASVVEDYKNKIDTEKKEAGLKMTEIVMQARKQQLAKEKQELDETVAESLRSLMALRTNNPVAGDEKDDTLAKVKEALSEALSPPPSTEFDFALRRAEKQRVKKELEKKKEKIAEEKKDKGQDEVIRELVKKELEKERGKGQKKGQNNSANNRSRNNTNQRGRGRGRGGHNNYSTSTPNTQQNSSGKRQGGRGSGRGRGGSRGGRGRGRGSYSNYNPYPNYYPPQPFWGPPMYANPYGYTQGRGTYPKRQ